MENAQPPVEQPIIIAAPANPATPAIVCHDGASTFDDLPRRLDLATLRVWGLATTITAVVFLVLTLIAFAAFLFTQSLIPAAAAVGLGIIFLICCWTGVSYNRLYYDSWNYTLRERDLDINFGVWWRTRRCIPRSRIQHVDVRQGPIARSFGIVEVSLFTAGTIAAVVAIPGISPAEAERLRAELLNAEGKDDDAAQAASPGHDAH